MNNKTALQTLVGALEVANQKGCYTLTQSKEIITALDFLLSQPDIQFGEMKAVKDDENTSNE